MAQVAGLGRGLVGEAVGQVVAALGEAGQIVVVTFILLMAWQLVTKARLNRKIWINLLSASAVITAIYYCIDRWPVH